MAWIETSPGQIYTGGSTSAGRPGSYCPASWTEDFDRGQMSTQVMIGRGLPSDIPVLRYVFPADTGPVPPPTGELNLNGSQTAATRLYVSRTDDLGTDAMIWLNYLHNGCSLTYQTLGTGKESRGYQVTGDVAEYPSYFEIPIFWTQGTTAVPHGPVDLTLRLTRETPQLWQDAYGVSHYGRMVFNRTDLINTSTDMFVTLADRILEIRGSNSVPRLETVTLDARTGAPGHNMNLMSSAAPEKPSRYMCCLIVDGRHIFQRMCFANAVRHHITLDEWTLQITLDIAEWAAQL
jgi:hypothetical protein